jgi:hypothetical protein
MKNEFPKTEAEARAIVVKAKEEDLFLVQIIALHYISIYEFIQVLQKVKTTKEKMMENRA